MPKARFDAQMLIAEFGDEGLLAELAALLLDHAEVQLAAVRHAIAAGDAPALRAAAHKIKGGMGTFGAEPVTRTAAALEVLGREGRVSEAAALADELALEIRALCDGARAWLAARAA